MSRIVLAADVGLESPSRDIALDTYHALKKAGKGVFFLQTSDQARLLEEEGLPSIALPDVEHSIIIAYREIKAFPMIDHTNSLVYMADKGVIEDFMVFMIHRVDRIIVPSYDIGFKLSAILQKMDLYTPVHRLQPWLDPERYKVARKHDPISILVRGPVESLQKIDNAWGFKLTHLGESSLAGWENTDKIEDWSEYDVYVNLESGHDFSVREAMMSGVIPVVPDRLPYTEFIINRLNGYRVLDTEDLLGAFAHLVNEENFTTVSSVTVHSAYQMMSLDVWAKEFTHAAYGRGVENLNGTELYLDAPISYRRWIVPKVVLRGGKPVSVPRHYNKNRFRVVNLGTVKEILMYFVAQKFMDVFIFDWEYDNIKSSEEKSKLLSLMRAIGRRGLNMYWCTDQDIPPEWTEVFRNMTILSVEDGLKKVKPPTMHDFRATT